MYHKQYFWSFGKSYSFHCNFSPLKTWPSFLATRTKQTSWHTIFLIGCNERKTFCPQSLQSSSSVIRKTFWNSSSQQKNHLVTCFPNNPIRKKPRQVFFSFLHTSEFSFHICLALLHACLLACCIPLHKKMLVEMGFIL